MSDMRREFGYLSFLSGFVLNEKKNYNESLWKVVVLFWELLINYNKLYKKKT